jgi:lipoprotein-anchoring transpeptidase ErfK/SrfK
MSTVPQSSIVLSRRRLLGMAALGGASVALSACTTVPTYPRYAGPEPLPGPEPELDSYAMMYGPVVDEGYEIPAVPFEKIDRQFLRQVVADPTGERPGTIVVDTASHFLYVVRERGEAVRYGVGLGRAGFELTGRAVIQW